MSSIRNIMKSFYHENSIGKLLLSPLIYYRNYIMSDKTYILKRFKRVMGYNLDLNNPRTLNEKIQWLKLYHNTPLHTQCADKYAVRDYVKNKIGEKYLVPLYLSTTDPKEITPERLPEFPFIIKTNHDSSGGIIVKDKTKINWIEIQQSLSRRLKKNYYHHSKEKQYKDIKPRIIVEKLLIDKVGNIPNDYKIHCFNGDPKIIQVDSDRFSNHKRNLYNANWELLPFTWSIWKNNKPVWDNGTTIPKPESLSTLIDLAKTLSKDFYYSRIDFYVVDKEIYFGEITFHHGGGTEIIFPKKWDSFYGDGLQIPINQG
ncbi:TupA-like ATPgrasp [Arenibacter palladensis]|uniref:TupA-like ATPgrasp n=2 Tax=Arenibacter palladensis TaxID=237373 RepID=A0A1M5EKQ6_9FLAO|nr:TupA-like ATPgrasp [Arenibacter palladensis]